MRIQETVIYLLLGLTLSVTPSSAQGGGPQSNLNARVTSLEQRVAALEAQPPGGGIGLVVVDALDQVVGIQVGEADTISFIGGRWVEATIDTNGFVPQSPSRQVWFTSSDCTGTALLNSLDIVRSGFTFDGQILQFAGDPVSIVTSNSSGQLLPNGTTTGCQQSVSSRKLGPLAQFDLSTLGLVTPFRITPP